MTETYTMCDTRRITCPSGLSGVVRGLKVKEERILADKRLAKEHRQMDALLAACWIETTCKGPYDFATETPPWGKILQGDRFYVLLQVRALTYGQDYDFSVPCTNVACRRRIQWTVPLDALPLRQLPEISRAATAGDENLSVQIPSGVSVNYKLPRGDDERALAAIRESQPDRLLSAALALRIVEVEGVPHPREARLR